MQRELFGAALTTPFRASPSGPVLSMLDFYLDLARSGWKAYQLDDYPFRVSGGDLSLKLRFEEGYVNHQRKESKLDIFSNTAGHIIVTYSTLYREIMSIDEAVRSECSRETTESVHISPSALNTGLISSFAEKMFFDYCEWTKTDDGVWVPPTAEPADGSERYTLLY